MNCCLINMIIDIAPEYEPTSKYQATLGHKINHDFRPNSQFVGLETPRFVWNIGLLSSCKVTTLGKGTLLSMKVWYNISNRKSISNLEGRRIFH